MGVVYHALDPSIGREVAIKTIRLAKIGTTSEEQLRSLFFREARAAGALRHPSIVTIYDIVEDASSVYLVMEYVNGVTLDRMMRERSGLDAASFLHILRQAAEALDTAHQRGIIHRDVKPANILVDENGDAKITDFGIAKILSKERTPTGIMMGTPSYIAPEYIREQPIDGRADQFALAVIAFEILTGRKPFQGADIASLMFSILQGAPPRVDDLNHTLSPVVNEVMAKALGKTPEDRYPTCKEWVRALESALQQKPFWRPALAIPATVPAPPPPARVTGTIPPPVASPPPPPVSTGPVEPVAPLPPPPPAGGIVTHPLNTAQVVKIPPPIVVPRRRNRSAVWAGVGIGVVLFAGVLFVLNRPESRPPEPSKPEPTPLAVTPTPARKKASRPTPTPTPSGSSEPSTNPSKSYEVDFTTFPARATVVADGDDQFTCQSPCKLDLKPGRHTLKVTLAGYRDAMRIIHVPPDLEVQIPLQQMAGRVFADSNPQGASITIDGKPIPDKTPASFLVPVGTHQLQFRLGDRVANTTVEIADGSLQNVTVSLQ